MSVEIIAEVGGSHGGSMEVAVCSIDAAAEQGADVVKFQCHPDGGGRPTFSDGQWETLKMRCDDKGVEFLVTPFTLDAVGRMNPLVKRWKIASGHTADRSLLHAVALTDKPVLLSTGMASEAEIAIGLECLVRDVDVTLMECVSLYPTPPKYTRVRPDSMWPDWGLSDHSRRIATSVLAVRQGASAIEVHVMSKYPVHPLVESIVHPDWEVSFDLDGTQGFMQFEDLVDEIRFTEQMREPPAKDDLLPMLTEVRAKYWRAT